MAALFRCNRILCTQFKQLHRSKSGSSVPTIDMKMERKAFLNVLPEVINSVVTGPKIKDMPELQSWIKKMLEYMLGTGKLGRGLMISIGYRMFEEPENYSEETQHSAHVLGWCVEMMQSTFLILDDIVDNATVRRGKPCWHLKRCVSLYGVNDSLILYESMLEVLAIYFGHTPIYGDLLKYYNESVYRATMGEHLDLWTTYRKEKNNLNVFNMNFINAIATNKTAHYSCKLPIFVPLILVKNGTKYATEELSNICIEFGRLIQIQDDYLDAYGDETVTGKSGRDIQEGKCSWVAVTALQHCNETQRAIFKEYYGSENPEHVKRIKQLYDELHLPKLYEKCERTIHEDLIRRINALPHERGRIFLLYVLNASYKRVS